MSSRKCTEIAELLVDFADGELAEVECDEVKAHLAECAGCREELELLKRSLCLAKSVWREDAAVISTNRETPPVEMLRSSKSVSTTYRYRTRRWAIGLSVAACASLALLPSVIWLPQRPVPDTPAPKTVAEQPTDTHPPLTHDEIDRLISRRVRCARLAVSVELLSSQPGLEKYRDDARRYLAEVSDAGGSVPRSFSNGRTR